MREVSVPPYLISQGFWFLKPKVRTKTFSVVERGPDDVVPEKSLCPALRLPAIVDLAGHA